MFEDAAAELTLAPVEGALPLAEATGVGLARPAEESL